MTVLSRGNAKVKWVRALARSRKEREQSRLFFVEGLHLALAAMHSGAPIELVVFCPERLTSAVAWEFVAARRQAGTPLLEVSPEVLSSLVYKESGQGIGVVVRQRWAKLDDLPLREPRCWVALEAVQYPGNLGTVLRTADAVGCGGVILLDNATDPYDSAAVRASMGGVFSQRLVRASSAAFTDWKRSQGLTVVGASPSAPTDYRALDYPLPLVLLMGRERGGLSPSLAALCDATVRIPMVGQCDSLNLAISTGVMLYGIYARHHPAPATV
jgi:TrmH family RNA methyltransferase